MEKSNEFLEVAFWYVRFDERIKLPKFLHSNTLGNLENVKLAAADVSRKEQYGLLLKIRRVDVSR